MSATVRGRVVRAPVTTALPVTPRVDLGHAGRRIAREELEAKARAKEIVENAEARAHATLAETEARADEEARAAEQARLSAMYLALHAAEERRAERDAERAVELAKLLAERLVGSWLDTHPETIALLAKQALVEARGARRARIEVNPADEPRLAEQLGALELPLGSVELVAEPALSRGSLVVHTDLGTLDARLTPQLDRLEGALRDALRPAS